MNNKTVSSVKSILVTMILIAALGGIVQSDKSLIIPLPNETLEDPTDPSVQVQAYDKPENLPVSELEEKPKDWQIEDAVYQAFGDLAPVALAIASAESNLRNNVTNIWGDKWNIGECSVGIFQINLRRQSCYGQLVHWDKVPGDTLEAKIEWLKDPYNNAKVAKQVYDERGNFSAWTQYVNGSYQKFLEN